MAPPGRTSRPVHIPALDGLCGVAIILVLLHQLNRLDETALPTRLRGHALDFGWIASSFSSC